MNQSKSLFVGPAPDVTSLKAGQDFILSLAAGFTKKAARSAAVELAHAVQMLIYAPSAAVDEPAPIPQTTRPAAAKAAPAPTPLAALVDAVAAVSAADIEDMDEPAPVPHKNLGDQLDAAAAILGDDGDDSNDWDAVVARVMADPSTDALLDAVAAADAAASVAAADDGDDLSDEEKEKLEYAARCASFGYKPKGDAPAVAAAPAADSVVDAVAAVAAQLSTPATKPGDMPIIPNIHAAPRVVFVDDEPPPPDGKKLDDALAANLTKLSRVEDAEKKPAPATTDPSLASLSENARWGKMINFLDRALLTIDKVADKESFNKLRKELGAFDPKKYGFEKKPILYKDVQDALSRHRFALDADVVDAAPVVESIPAAPPTTPAPVVVDAAPAATEKKPAPAVDSKEMANKKIKATLINLPNMDKATFEKAEKYWKAYPIEAVFDCSFPPDNYIKLINGINSHPLNTPKDGYIDAEGIYHPDVSKWPKDPDWEGFSLLD